MIGREKEEMGSNALMEERKRWEVMNCLRKGVGRRLQIAHVSRNTRC